ncbi:MAG: hypothetical protein FWG72_03760 [Oscillospiraceae bacterium]|nr:hypothetical protein [Oscillospiraceae bacterium]
MTNKFTPEVQEKIKSYVYRLIDPRNGNTFYVGKGNGNRVFEHMNGVCDKDNPSEKIGIINGIRAQGLEVLHVIHRHGLDDKTALEVEAALIDAYPGLSNEIRGHNSDLGAKNAYQIQEYYGAEVIEAIPEKCILIKIRQEVVEQRDGSIYETVRAAWKLSRAKAERADYVFAVCNGLVKGIYTDLKWSEEEARSGRLKFDGVQATGLEEKYIGKRIPLKYSKKGTANPCQYVNC